MAFDLKDTTISIDPLKNSLILEWTDYTSYFKLRDDVNYKDLKNRTEILIERTFDRSIAPTAIVSFKKNDDLKVEYYLAFSDDSDTIEFKLKLQDEPFEID